MASLPSPSPETLSRINKETVSKAVDALLKWVNSKTKNQKAQLLEHDEFIYLFLTLKKVPQKSRVNPYKIPLPHPLHSFDSSQELCLIIDDRSRSSLTSEAAKKKIQSEGIPISKILKISKLKSDYRPFEAKRKLCHSFDLFFADKRVVPVLPRLLGKQFFKKKKIPVPVDLTHKNWKEQIERGCGSALMYLKMGTCCVVKIGRVSMGRDEIVENVFAVIDGAVDIVPRKWDNVRSLHLKVTESLALPIYQCLPEIGLKIDDGIKKEETLKEIDGVEKDLSEKKDKMKKKKGWKGGRIHEMKFMGSDVDEEEEDMGDVESDDDNDEMSGKGEMGSVELSGKKRRNAEETMNGNEKKEKKSVNGKKVNVKKQKKDENEVEEAQKQGSTGLKLKKKSKEVGKLENGEMKMKKDKKKIQRVMAT